MNMMFCSALLTLSLILHINEAKQTQLMESLQCLNDYKSFVSCTWSEHKDLQKFIKMSLFYKTERSGGFKNMTNCSTPNIDIQSRIWNCYRSQTFFNALEEQYYTFKPDRKLEVQLNVRLFDNVQPPPPKELDISLTKEDDFLLTWKSGGGTNESHWLDDVLEYEVAYKRDWESWERSTSVFVSNVSRCLLHHTDLVTGSAYVARVRSKPRQNGHLSGRYSEWSSTVKWTKQEGDEAQPKNLRCLFNGLDWLTCSWELRRELTGSLSFALFYKISPDSIETPCFPVEEKELPDPLHVLQSCKINVTNPERLSQYLITVRPKEEEKIIEPVRNIKADPPFGLSVKRANNQLYKLEWKDIKHEDLRLYQVSYWEADKKSEKNISGNLSQFTFSFPLLKPGTRYKTQMRAKVHHGSIYGPWSTWSEEHEWVTESELPSWSFTLAVPVFIILGMVGLCCSKRYLLRKKREWDKNIPRPPSMFLRPDYFTKIQLPESLEESSRQSSLEEFTSSNALERSMLVRCPNALAAESWKIRSLSAVLQNTETTEFSEAKLDQCVSHAELSPRLAHSHKAEMGLAHQVFDFNGPYLMSLQESPVPDAPEDVAPSEMKGIPVSMQYVELPHGFCSQILPVGKEKGTIPPICTVHSEEKEKLPLSGRRQEVSENQLTSDILEKSGNKDQGLQSPTSTNNHSKNGILDYFTTAELSRERGSLFLLPKVALKEGMVTCAMKTSASQLSQASDDSSSSELYQKETDTVLPPKDQSSSIPSVTSQDVFGDYFITIP